MRTEEAAPGGSRGRSRRPRLRALLIALGVLAAAGTYLMSPLVAGADTDSAAGPVVAYVTPSCPPDTLVHIDVQNPLASTVQVSQADTLLGAVAPGASGGFTGTGDSGITAAVDGEPVNVAMAYVDILCEPAGPTDAVTPLTSGAANATSDAPDGGATSPGADSGPLTARPTFTG